MSNVPSSRHLSQSLGAESIQVCLTDTQAVWNSGSLTDVSARNDGPPTFFVFNANTTENNLPEKKRPPVSGTAAFQEVGRIAKRWISLTGQYVD